MVEMDIKTISLIVFGIIILYLLYKTRKIQSETGKIEEFAATTDKIIDDKIKEIYNADIDAIRNLSDIATKITEENDSLTIPVGNTIIAGKLTVNGDVEFVKRNDMLMNIIPSGFILAHYKDYDPKGWATCDGQSYILSPNGDAVAVLSTTPGAIPTPDLRSRFIIGSSGTAENQTITNNGAQLKSRPYGGWGGEENVALTEAQMPAHTHYLFVNQDGGVGSPWTLYPNVAGINTYVYGVSNSNNNTERYRLNAGSSTPANAGVSGWKGGSMPHNNMPPYFSLKYYMKL
jgi:microcystin-dependent protein